MSEITKQATTFQEQILMLESRGVIIKDKAKAEEILSDIGYYRLGFYLFPFERTYPELGKKRCHEVNCGTTIEDAVALYYYDFDLRNILNKYLSRIEVAIRTTMIYELSNKYKSNPTWFVDDSVVTDSFIASFDKEVYHSIAKKAVIKRHKKKNPTHKYAPAWKTLEFMMFGNLTTLYKNLLLVDDQRLISKHFGVNKVSVFSNYIESIREVRNTCAHGNVLYDFNTYIPVKKGPAGVFEAPKSSRLVASLGVVRFFLSTISSNRLKDMDNELMSATNRLYSKCPSLQSLIESKTGIIV